MKKVIITGGAGFLGRQIFESFIELNHKKIIIIDNSASNIRSFSKKYKKYKNKFIIFKADICSEINIIEINKNIIKKFKKVDILVNNASIDYKPDKIKKEKDSFFNTSLNAWQYELSVCLTGSLICSKVFCKYMAKNNSGIILNIC